MRGTQQRNLRLESLEPRLPLAGLVTAALVDDDLIVTGDAAFNKIEITPKLDAGVAVPGAFEIHGLDGTSVNAPGQTSALVENVEDDVVVKMPKGGYEVSLAWADGQNLVVLGDVRAVLAPGGKGTLSRLEIYATEVGGDLSVKTKPGSHVVDLSFVTVGGDARVETNKGYNRVSLGHLDVVGDVNVTGVRQGPAPQKITQNDVVHIHDIQVDGNVSLKGVPGSNNTVRLRQAEVTGKFTSRFGAGRDNVTMISSEMGEVEMTAGGGADRLTLRRYTTVDKVFANLGAGSDLVEILDSTVETDARLLTSDGPDVVGVLGGTVGGEFYLNTAQGADTVFLGRNASWIPQSRVWSQVDKWDLPYTGVGLKANSANILTGGGNDWLEMQVSPIAFDAQISTGAGNDRAVLKNTQFGGNLRLETGAGSDVIGLVGNEVTGQTVVLAGGGNDRLRASGNELTGDLALNMGAGRDVLTARLNRVVGSASLSGGSQFDVLAEQENEFGSLSVVQFEKIK